jgi:hypothetical protein
MEAFTRALDSAWKMWMIRCLGKELRLEADDVRRR